MTNIYTKLKAMLNLSTCILYIQYSNTAYPCLPEKYKTFIQKYILYCCFRAMVFANISISICFHGLSTWLPSYFHDTFPQSKVSHELGKELGLNLGLILRIRVSMRIGFRGLASGSNVWNRVRDKFRLMVRFRLSLVLALGLGLYIVKVGIRVMVYMTKWIDVPTI
jgi:hypothetical protein